MSFGSTPGYGLNGTDTTASFAPARGAAKGSLQHAANDFESILLNQWLEGAESSFGSVPGGDDDQDAGDAQLKSFAVQFLAKSITAAGGIGIAKLVSKALADQDQTGSATNAHGSHE